MEFFILDASYKPGPTIQNYETLVWTERYVDPGEFKLEVKNEVSILTKLPVGSLVSHTDTDEVMIVEDHVIDRAADRKLTITVTGRSFETFGENRPIMGSENPMKHNSGAPNYDPTDDWVTTTGVMTSPDLVQLILRTAFQTGYAVADDVIPNLIVTQNVVVPDSAMAQTISRGDVYPKILEYLRLFNGGIKTIRPTGAATALNLQIHDGVDRQATVIFYALHEDLENAQYLWSNRNYKTHAQIATEIDKRLYRTRDLVSDVTGLNRRTMYVEASDIKGLFPTPAANDVVSARGQTALDAHPKIALLSAKVAKTAKPKFKIHYDVGDKVTVFSEFAPPQPMRVVEHILTKDSKGIVGSPSLSVI